MVEPTNPPPRPERPRLIAAGTGLSPVQEAYGDWVGHQLECAGCHDTDAGPCETATRLRREWEELANAAVGRVSDA